MKIILTAEVDHLGSAGDTVEVKDGYGRNYLLPRGLAIVASRGAERQADAIRRAREVKTVRGLDHANELKTALEDLGTVTLPARTASDTGKLFGSVTAADIVGAIKRPADPVSTSGRSNCRRLTSRPWAPIQSLFGYTPTWMLRSRST